MRKCPEIRQILQNNSFKFSENIIVEINPLLGAMSVKVLLDGFIGPDILGKVILILKMQNRGIDLSANSKVDADDVSHQEFGQCFNFFAEADLVGSG